MNEELTYVDCSGAVKPLDKYHLHELLDRLHVMQDMWESVIQNHPACSAIIPEYAEIVQKTLGKAYQDVGRVEFDCFGGDY
jgi:predicted nucleic acid-binding Zn ribbon protein